MNRSYLELKVGIFVVCATLVFIVGLIFFGNRSIASDGYDVKVHFRFTNGLLKGAPVRYSGVNVGKVSRIDILSSKGLIELTMRINKDFVLHKDVEININTLGVVGEKYVEMMGGSSSKGLVVPGSDVVLKGNDPLSVNELSEMAFGLVEESFVL